MAPQSNGPNVEQIRYWDETAGPKWVALENVLDDQIAPLGRAAMDRLDLRPGERVLDVGCGCGGTTVGLAAAVGEEGTVLGVDVSSPMLERARARTATTGNVRLLRADVQTHGFEPGSFDAAFSRFGVMFFEDPVAAFGNVRCALRSGGRLAFVCWRGIEENPWLHVPLGAAAQHVPLPPPPEAGAPGPFSLADADRVRAILAAAGWQGVGVDPHDQTLLVGGSGGIAATIDFLLQIGPLGAAIREAGIEDTAPVAASIAEALAPHVTAEGVRMASAAWIVTARNP